MSNEFNDRRFNETFAGRGYADLWDSQRKLAVPKNYGHYGRLNQPSSEKGTPSLPDFGELFDTKQPQHFDAPPHTAPAGRAAQSSPKPRTESGRAWIWILLAVAIIVGAAAGNSQPPAQPRTADASVEQAITEPRIVRWDQWQPGKVWSCNANACWSE